MSSWEIRFSKSRQLPYFYDSAGGASTWERPEGISEEQITSLPGAHYLQQHANGSGNGDVPEGQVRASHLLVKHRDSRRPSSWKEKNITRSVEEAEGILREHANTLGSKPTPDQFGQLAKTHSDCSSAAKGGDLGFFGRGQMQKPFEDATYGLQVGEMSDVIKSDSGLHLILRTA
ncbi:rotamase-domain-containing protein [Meira miltonrushii]|uniref:Peptidyl-prolyl cis-trans isomerase n=1 Tax=Meira miltonrushii TaxID=1280837 RepID=A0A316V3J8_9BASI|nr:rotamase-domain-containing protein [Meira miltonrushii]PWN32129.1 rotamase-domain-containing protein [Meira miltonrushii]